MDIFYSLAGVEITYQVMTIACQSTGYQNPIGPMLKRVQRLHYIQPAGTRQLHNLNLWGVLQPQRTGQIGGGVGAVTTAKRHNLGGKIR
jgi:hypothetical protein